MMSRLREMPASDRGATASEYAILMGFLVVALVGGITVFGSAVNGWFSDLATTVGGLLG